MEAGWPRLGDLAPAASVPACLPPPTSREPWRGPWWVLTCPRGQGRNDVGGRELCLSDLANPLLVPPLGLSLPTCGVEVGQMAPHFHVRLLL